MAKRKRSSSKKTVCVRAKGKTHCGTPVSKSGGKRRKRSRKARK